MVILGTIATVWWMAKKPEGSSPTAGKTDSWGEVSRGDYKLALQPSFGLKNDSTLQMNALLVHGEKATGDWTFEVNGDKRIFKKEEIAKGPIRGFSAHGPLASYAHSLPKGMLKPGKAFEIRVRFQGKVDGKSVDLTTEDRVTVPGMNLRMDCDSKTLTVALTHAKEARGYWSVTTNPLNPPPDDEGASEFTRKSSLTTVLRHTISLEGNSRVEAKVEGMIDGVPWEIRAHTAYENCKAQDSIQVEYDNPNNTRATLPRLRYRPVLIKDSEGTSRVKVTAWMKTDQPVEGTWIIFLQGKEQAKEMRHTFSKKKMTVELPVKELGHYKLGISFLGTENGRIVDEKVTGDIKVKKKKGGDQ